MRMNLLLGFVVAFVLVFSLGSETSFAETSTYHISGYVRDVINHTGIPDAQVTLMSNATLGNNGEQAVTVSDNPTLSSNKSDNLGYFEFNVSRTGNYQVFAKKVGLNGSLNESYGWGSYFTVTENNHDYFIGVELMLTKILPNDTETVTPVPSTAAQTPTPIPSVTASPNPSTITTDPMTSTQTPNTTSVTPTAPAVRPTNTYHPTPISNPAATPGFLFTLIPSLIVISLVAIKKRN